jgi:transcription antitermination factor NusG
VLYSRNSHIVLAWSFPQQERRHADRFHFQQKDGEQRHAIYSSTTQLSGKLWDKLQIEPDPIEEPPQWYVLNCVAGLEMDLLAQCQHVTKDMSRDLVEKLSVPTERALRSHGKMGNVVELRTRYPGYVFVKMRLCAETYEALQQLPLCRSWMAGTVNRQGYKKLPPAPIALSDEEVDKFKGLDDATDAMYDQFGEEYTGRGDKGMDLIDQYKGYQVEEMVKVISGNFKGEDGIVRRLKDGMVCVRLYTYGTVNDQWFRTDQIRPMSDEEAMRGLTGPNAAIGQEEFNKDIRNIKDTSSPTVSGNRRMDGKQSLRSNLVQSMGGDFRRMRRQDRVGRGDTSGSKIDRFGRSDSEAKEEEDNWRIFNEDQRAQQQQKRGDQWGIKERNSWSGVGDDPLKSVDAQWGRQTPSRDSGKAPNQREKYANIVQDAVSGTGDWDAFSSKPNTRDNKSSKTDNDDDFFTTLMAELSQDSSSPRNSVPSKSQSTRKDDNNASRMQEDDFFSSLLSDLSGNEVITSGKKSVSQSSSAPSISPEDDFFASLQNDLSSPN